MKNSPKENDGTDPLYQRIRTEEHGRELLPLAEAEVSRICEELNASQSIETVAKTVYRRAIKNNVVNNRSIAKIAPSAVFISCRIENEPRPLSKIKKVSHSSERDISRTYADLSRDLELNVGPVDPKDYIHRFCTELDLDEETEYKAKQLVDESIEEEVHVGKAPSSVAAASVYIATLLCNEPRTQQEVANVAAVSTTTIGNMYREQSRAISYLPN